MKILYLLMLLSCTGVCLAESSIAIQVADSRDPTYMINAVSSDIGVTPQQFRDCLNSSAPKSGGSIDMNIVAQCLQPVKPGITAEQLNASMVKNRPKPSQAPLQNQ